jgi:dTDP-L-rhamnose 4-epimerase
MKVMLTGGAGFIGSVVRSQLEAAGHDVVVFDRALDPRDDVTALERVRFALPGCSTIIHLAAKVGLGVELSDIDDYVRQNDLGTAVVLRAAADAGVSRVVYASSMVVYGEGAYSCPDHGPVAPPPRAPADLERRLFEPVCPFCGCSLVPGLVPESAPMDPRNVYAATKVHGEQLASIWSRETTGVVAALRFHNVYGPGMPRDTPYAGVASLFRASLEQGRPAEVFEDGRQRRNFVHVADVAHAAVAATLADLPPGFTPLNIGSAHVTTVGEIAQALSTALSGPDPIITGRYRLGDVRHITAECSAAERVLGWRAEIELSEGIQSLLAIRQGSDVAEVAASGAKRA